MVGELGDLLDAVTGGCMLKRIRLIALGLAGMLISCLTCCIGSLPYVSTVLLLPEQSRTDLRLAGLPRCRRVKTLSAAMAAHSM